MLKSLKFVTLYKNKQTIIYKLRSNLSNKWLNKDCKYSHVSGPVHTKTKRINLSD